MLDSTTLQISMVFYRYLLLAILTTMGVTTVHVSAQSIPNSYRSRLRDTTAISDRKISIVKANTLSFLTGDFNITYERLSRITPRSLIVKLDYQNYSTTNIEYRGPSLLAGLRYYLTKKRQPPAGYYVQPFFTYGEYKVQEKAINFSGRIKYIGGGIIGGLQWAIGNRVTIEVFLGGGYVNVTTSYNYRIRGILESFLPILGASTGFRF